MYPAFPFPRQCLWLLAVGLLSCQSETAPVQVVAQRYLEARLAGDFAAAGQFVHPASLDLFHDLKTLHDRSAAGLPPVAFSLTEVSILTPQQEAVATYYLPGYGQDQLSLRKAPQGWRIHLSPHAVPDAGLLMGELQRLEYDNYPVAYDQESLDLLLMQDEGEEWSVLTGL